MYAKMLKETGTEETIDFLVTFLSLVLFQSGGGGAWLRLCFDAVLRKSRFNFGKRCRASANY